VYYTIDWNENKDKYIRTVIYMSGLRTRNLHIRHEFDYTTGTTGAIAKEFNPGKPFEILEIRLHLSAAGGAGNLTAILDCGQAATVYDSPVFTAVDMTSLTDYVYGASATTPRYFDSGDHIDIAFANASNRTYGLTIVWKPIV
jgi:hypothetical protein